MNHIQSSGQESVLKPVTAPALLLQGITHGYFTREGGVSQGLYRGLNVGIGSSDDRVNVHENRKRVAHHLNVLPERLMNPWQIHSNDVVSVSQPFQEGRPKADAIVTNVPGLAVAVVTADCGPVLFADAKAGVIGAAHAGWKGAIGGVLENTITAMEALGANRGNMVAVLGPSISQDNYEVGPEFLSHFAAHNADNARWFVPSIKDGHFMFDLWGFTLERLTHAGVAASCTGQCTYADEDRFYSYRRTTHRAEPDYGRQISAIILND